MGEALRRRGNGKKMPRANGGRAPTRMVPRLRPPGDYDVQVEVITASIPRVWWTVTVPIQCAYLLVCFAARSGAGVERRCRSRLRSVFYGARTSSREIARRFPRITISRMRSMMRVRRCAGFSMARYRRSTAIVDRQQFNGGGSMYGKVSTRLDRLIWRGSVGRDA